MVVDKVYFVLTTASRILSSHLVSYKQCFKYFLDIILLLHSLLKNKKIKNKPIKNKLYQLLE